MTNPISQLEEQLNELTPEQRQSTAGIDVLNELAWQLGIADDVRLRSLSEEALRYSQAQGYLLGEAQATRNLAYWQLWVGDGPSNAVDLAQTAVYQFQDAGDIYGEATAWDILALSFTQLGVLDRALACNNKSVQLYAEAGYANGQAWGYHNLGMIYEQGGELEQAVTYYQSSLDLFEQLAYANGIAAVCNRLASTYRELGQHQAAIAVSLKSIEYWRQKELPFNVGVIEVHLRMSQMRLYLGDIVDALAYHAKCKLSLDVLWQEDTPQKINFMIRLGLQHGRILRAQGDLSASNACLQAELARLQAGIDDHLASLLHQELSVNYEAMGQFKTALQHRKRYDELEEALLANERRLKRKNLLLSQNIVQAEKEKETQRLLQEKTEKILLQALPQPIVEQVRQFGKAQPSRYELATVLFAEFVDFTEMAATMSAEDLAVELDSHFSQFDKIIAKYGLEKMKTIRDGYMAVAGVPQPHADHALRAVRAALELQAYIRQVVAVNKQQGLPTWTIRIGINSGPLVAGVIGTQKFAYDMWGNTVSIASSMESFGEAGHINISRQTYFLIKDVIPCHSRSEITIKHGKKLEAYLVTSSD